jgi:GDP-D-mannose dehydratase
MKTALIYGITGQDGSYLSELLLNKGYQVIGVNRRVSINNTERLTEHSNLKLIYGDIVDPSSVNEIINKYKPDECYNLAAQSHVGISFNQPSYTWDVCAKGPLFVLEAIKQYSLQTRYYQACHDIETMVLTPNGIKKYSELNIGDLVYTLNNNTRNIELKPILKILEYDYNGDMVCFKSRRINQCVTPNHKVWLIDDNDSLLIEKAYKINKLFKQFKLSNYSMPVGKHNNMSIAPIPQIILEQSVENNSKNLISSIDSYIYATLLGLYIGDGYIKKAFYNQSNFNRKDRQNFRNEKGQFLTIKSEYIKSSKFTSRIEFAIPKNDKARSLICQLLTDAGLEFNFNDNIVWCSCFGLAKKLIEDAGCYFDKKRINESVYKYNRQFLQNLLYGLLYSDGDGKRQYFTSNENLAIDIIHLIFTLGYYPSLQKKEDYVPKYSKKLNRYITQTIPRYIIGIGYSGKNKLYKEHISNKQYNGKVWCLEIQDNHNFLIIRDGKIAFSGNSTSEMFGSNCSVVPYWNPDNKDPESAPDKYEQVQNELTPFSPNSPYAIAKTAAHHTVRMYRDAYKIHASAGILFNHESERRGENFVTRKITRYIGKLVEHLKSHHTPYAGRYQNETIKTNIRTGEIISSMGRSIFPRLKLGNIDAVRDWGHAKDYVKAMWLILQQDKPDDYIVGTGKGHTVREFLEEAFSLVSLDCYDFIEIDPELYRPNEVPYLRCDASKAKNILKWTPEIYFDELIKIMVESDIKCAEE